MQCSKLALTSCAAAPPLRLLRAWAKRRPLLWPRKRAHLRDAAAAVQGEAREGMPRERRHVPHDALVGQRLAPVQQQRGQARQRAQVPQACTLW